MALFSIFAMGQGNDSTKIVIYDPFNPNQTVDTKKDITYEKNQIKWNLGMLMRGAFEMDYERVLGDKFTIQAGAGITYLDLMYSVLRDIESIDMSNMKYKYGPLLTADMRFYPGSVADFDGFYVSLFYRYRKYNAIETVTSYIDNKTYSTEMTNSHQHSELGFMVGWQTGDYLDLVYDYYFGIGLSNITKVSPDRSNYNSLPFEKTEYLKRPVIFMGIRMGFPF
jgi:hypothetical protein